MTLRKEAEAPSRGDTKLVCRKCRAGSALVTRTTQYLRRDGREGGKTLHVAVQCSNRTCQREWWSRAKSALEINRLLEAQVKVETTP